MFKLNRRSFLGMTASCAAFFPGGLTDLSAMAEESQTPLPPLNPSQEWIASPFDVGSKTQLFVDKVLVRETRNAVFTLHPAAKHPANPLIKADRPWEGWRIELYGSVLYDADEKLFKMWYQGETSKCFPNYVALYATSQDGVHWQKPLVNTVPCVDGEAKTNAVLADCILPGVIKDPIDPDPARRYKMICWMERKPADGGGYRTFVSPDGLHWTSLSKTPITPGGDVITGYYDPERRLFVAFSKIETPFRGHRRRIFYLNTSKDFNSWTKPELVWTPDLRDDAGSLGRIARYQTLLSEPNNLDLMRTEYYGIGAYRHESCTLAFPWIFTVNNNIKWGNQDGLFELQLGVSRDLKNWHRPFRVPCLQNGEMGEWDCGLITTPSEAMRVKDEIWLFYGGSNYTHGTPALYVKSGAGQGTKYTGSIGLAKWKLDRFVSIDGPEKGGSMVTVPMVFSGSNLELNANVMAGGSIVVHVLDAGGQPIKEWKSSRALRGDDLRHKVIWPEGQALESLKGRPITLQFDLKNAELYSFAFKA